MVTKQTGVRKKASTLSVTKIAAYAGAFLILVSVVAVGYESPQRSSQIAAVSSDQSSVASAAALTPSVDEVVATDIAADLAARANLPVATNIANMSISLAAKNELAQTDISAITKPQIIQPTSSRTDIIEYTTVNGDTVPSIAAKFGLTADTIRWSNDLGNSDVIAENKKIVIPPVDGLIHNVTGAETLEAIAAKYNATASRITTVNNLELTGVQAGQRLIIPGGTKPAPTPPPAPRNSSQSYGSNLGGSRLGMNVFATAGNRYAPGNCTWYVYERRLQIGRPIGSFWGNANTWASNARAAGYTVNRTPAAGAVLSDPKGNAIYGHVAVVERVLPNGDIYITEMNNYAYGGFNIVNDRTISAGQAAGYEYIH